jgi:glycosyltransferase involved in cell wall biosynthesis
VRAERASVDPIGEYRIARVISRLNVGGPAIQAISLTKLLEPLGYHTVLVRGSESEHEGSMDYLAQQYGVLPVKIAAMGREIGPPDAPAFARLAGILRDFRPHIVHTHAAKAGTLGRAAALAASPRKRPLLVHTFHGHSLSGYFSDRRNRVLRAIERGLARRTDRLIAVSEQVRDDLVGFGVAPREKFTVIPLGFDLARFDADEQTQAQGRAQVRAELGLADDTPVVTLFARLVPIKRVDRFLRIAARVAERVPEARFVIAGDGELRDELRGMANGAVKWTGFRRDVPELAWASDVVVQTSDNEGTPVSLIEAHAARRPVVSTRVGGSAAVVQEGRSGALVDRDDEERFAEAIVGLLQDPARRVAMGEAGREHVLGTFGLERLVRDHDLLYRSLLGTA